MKNGKAILLLICGLSLCLLLGVFIGRNLKDEYVKLPDNADFEVVGKTVDDMEYKLDLNTASKTQLMEIPGIGEITADRIIQYREINGSFNSVDDLMNIEGIGEKKILQIEVYLKVGG